MARRVTPCSPSKLAGARACPKFRRIDRDDSANIGTMLHEAFESGDVTGLSQDEAEIVRYAQTAADALRDELAYENPGVPVVLHKELHVRYDPLALEGTLDWAGICGKNAVILDLKTGQAGLPSQAADNVQVKAYALGFFQMFPEVEQIKGALTNPRTMEHTDNLVLTRADIPVVEAELRAIIEAYEKPFSPPTPGEHCTLCQNTADCPALKPTIMEHGRVLFPMLPEDLNPANPNISLCARGVRKLLIGLLENYVESVKEADKAFCEMSDEVPLGFKRMSRSTGVRLLDECKIEAFRRLLEKYPKETVFGSSSVALGDLAKNIPAESEARAKAELYALLDGCTREGVTTYLQRDKKGASVEEILDAYRSEQDERRRLATKTVG